MSKILVNTIGHTGDTTAMTIDSGGRILQPAKPAFQVIKSGTDQSVSSATVTKIEWTTAVTDVGGHFSIANNEYTVPVSGMYNLQCCLRGSGTAGTLDYLIIYLYLDGAILKNLGQLNIRSDELNNSHVNGSANVYLTAGDVISFYGSISGGSPFFGAGNNGAFTYCSGYLIG
jgi:hypothetical protein